MAHIESLGNSVLEKVKRTFEPRIGACSVKTLGLLGHRAGRTRSTRLRHPAGRCSFLNNYRHGTYLPHGGIRLFCAARMHDWPAAT
jgi:hypothetical protein